MTVALCFSSWILHLKGSMQGRGALFKTFLLYFTVLMQISMQFILIFFAVKIFTRPFAAYDDDIIFY